MEKSVLLLGGDRRQTWLARGLGELGRVDTLAVPELPDTARRESYDIVILPCPCLDPAGKLRTSGEGLPLSVLDAYLGAKTLVFGGAIGAAAEALAGRCAGVADLLADPDVVRENARITSEAAILLVQTATETSLSGQRVGVLGFGRIGSCLARLLCAYGAEVTVGARREAARLAARVMGCESCAMEALPAGQTLVFNTVPARTLTQKQLEALGEDCLWVELASAPGGLPEAASGQPRRLAAGGLPGRLLPRSAAEVLRAGVLRALASETAN